MSSDSAKENASVVDSSLTEWKHDMGNSDDPEAMEILKLRECMLVQTNQATPMPNKPSTLALLAIYLPVFIFYWAWDWQVFI
ncbi:hypothetical protein OIU79_008579 [Salix purpurea]|uniref:Uncharacterized protein n=1 Tax=Salix purpurea TaxID=77065 RepID=A0A9Q0TIQ0_SALPP|nr:hypothetical protein OIU79_008579 [Salix purpurea]